MMGLLICNWDTDVSQFELTSSWPYHTNVPISHVVHDGVKKLLLSALYSTSKVPNTKGCFSSPPKSQVDCYVNANFAGLFQYEDNQWPICVESRTGFILIFSGCPLMWASKLLSEIALSMTEGEYIALRHW